MKKTSLFIYIFFSIHFVLHAQFEKGMRIEGGSIATANFLSGNTDVSFNPATTQGYITKTNNYNLNFMPLIGWFLNHHSAVGLTLNLAPSGSKTSYISKGTTFQQDKSNSFQLGIGVFGRNYFGNENSNWLPFVQLSLNGGLNNLTTSGFKYIDSSNSVTKKTYNGKSNGGTYFNSTLMTGVTKKISKNLGLDVYVGYNFSYSKNHYIETNNWDYGNNGTIDYTGSINLINNYTGNGAMFGIGLQVFLDARK